MDERVRVGRARSVAVLACGAPMVLISFAVLTLPASYRVYHDFAPLLLTAAFLVAILFNAIPLRERMRVA